MTEPSIADLKKIPVFLEFTPGELEILRQATRTRAAAEGEVVFEEGDQSDFICFVVEGRLEVIQKASDGRPVKVSILDPGESFGEMALMEKSPRSATVKALAPSSLVVLDHAKFESMIRDKPEAAVKMLMGLCRMLSKRLRQTNHRLIDCMAE
jgi:CRP/FNR family cyclic AMP-dependent transcriptional regulator